MTEFFKVVCTDNFNRDTVADTLVIDSLSKDTAERVADERNKATRHGPTSPHSYRLKRGMEDLV